MQKGKLEVDSPVSIEDKYMYAMVVRLDALCHMVSSLVEHIASKDNVATQENVVKDSSVKRSRKTKEV